MIVMDPASPVMEELSARLIDASGTLALYAFYFGTRNLTLDRAAMAPAIWQASRSARSRSRSTWRRSKALAACRRRSTGPRCRRRWRRAWSTGRRTR